jgi:DNA-binding transcriptional regulator YhcF (GntR family)
MPKRPNRNKRIDAPHVRLYGWLLNSPAYLSLSCPARALLVEVTRLYNGRNNGQIGLSVRRASERCNIARGTAQRAFAELQERQFIEIVTKGAFSRKSPHASEWRLTFVACNVTGELASKAFMRWGREKQNAVSKYPATASNQSHRVA